jgi:hypothetical protein
MPLTVENAGALCPGNITEASMPVKTKEDKIIETVTIRAIKNFYINGAIVKANDVVKDVWIVEAKGYVATKKAVIIEPAPAPAAKPTEKAAEKPSEEKAVIKQSAFGKKEVK